MRPHQFQQQQHPQPQQRPRYVVVDLSCLPDPDERGSFWFGHVSDAVRNNPLSTKALKEAKFLPAVFRIRDPASPDRGLWMACPEALDETEGPFVPFDEGTGRIRAFESPLDALEWLRNNTTTTDGDRRR